MINAVGIVPVNLVEAAFGAEPDDHCEHAYRAGDVVYCHATTNLQCSLSRCTKLGDKCPLYKKRMKSKIP